MWKLLELVYETFNRDGLDYFTDMMPLLHNYVTVDTDAFLANPDRPKALVDMCKTMLEKDPGEDPECHAGKLLEVIVLQCKGRNVHELVTSSAQLALGRLQREIRTSELRTMCIQVAIATLYFDPNLLFGVLQNSEVISQFIAQWLDDTDCFIGIHDRKLCILGLCQLLNMPNVPGVSANASKMMPIFIMLFDGLRRAYEAAQESDDDEDSDEDEEGDDDDGETLESDEDEIDEEGQAYLESLQRRANKAAAAATGMQITATIGYQHNGEGQEDDDDDADSDLYEETSMESYTTPIDDEDAGPDEYNIFKVSHRKR